MTEAELEMYARHLSLPGVGMKGQETLLGLRVTVQSQAAWAPALRLGLARAGVCLTPAEPHDAQVRAREGKSMRVREGGAPGEIRFSEGLIEVGEIAAPPLWLGALLAAEILMRALDHRGPGGVLRIAFPDFSFAP